MEMISILVRQILQMFLLSGIGFVLYKTHKITQEGSKTLGNILIYLALPAVIINGFLVEYNTEHVLGIVYSAATAAVLLLLSILIARLFFRKDAIAAFAGAFRLRLPHGITGSLTPPFSASLPAGRRCCSSVPR